MAFFLLSWVEEGLYMIDKWGSRLEERIYHHRSLLISPIRSDPYRLFYRVVSLILGTSV